MEVILISGEGIEKDRVLLLCACMCACVFVVGFPELEEVSVWLFSWDVGQRGTERGSLHDLVVFLVHEVGNNSEGQNICT